MVSARCGCEVGRVRCWRGVRSVWARSCRGGKAVWREGVEECGWGVGGGV